MEWIKQNWIQAGFLAAAGAVVLFLLIRSRVQVAKFIAEVRVELAKCSWPWDPLQTGLRRYKELIDSTVVVIVAMVLLGAYTSAFDYVLMHFTGLFIHL